MERCNGRGRVKKKERDREIMKISMICMLIHKHIFRHQYNFTNEIKTGN